MMAVALAPFQILKELLLILGIVIHTVRVIVKLFWILQMFRMIKLDLRLLQPVQALDIMAIPNQLQQPLLD